METEGKVIMETEGNCVQKIIYKWDSEPETLKDIIIKPTTCKTVDELFEKLKSFVFLNPGATIYTATEKDSCIYGFIARSKDCSNEIVETIYSKDVRGHKLSQYFYTLEGRLFIIKQLKIADLERNK